MAQSRAFVHAQQKHGVAPGKTNVVLYQDEPGATSSITKVTINIINNIIIIIVAIIRLVLIIMPGIESIAAAICLLFCSTPIGPPWRREDIKAGRPAKCDQYPLFGVRRVSPVIRFRRR